MTPHRRPFVSLLLRLALLFAATLLPFVLRAQACVNTRQDVVRGAFVQVLRREAEPTAVSAYTAYLNGGATVRALVSDLANSAEYRDRFIAPNSDRMALTLLYRHLLAREPDANAWGYLNVAATSGWGVVISSLLNSQEYTDRFGDRAVPGDPVVAWDCIRPGVALAPATAAPIMERDLCLAVGIGSGAAYECGDLRLAHALPSMRTLNKARTPVLIYNNQHAYPMPHVTAYVTIPAGMAADSVRMTLVGSDGVVLARRNVGAWPGGQERYTGVSFNGSRKETGLYGYTLQVRLTSGSTTLATYSMRGELGIVNRNASPFGMGWWVAGLEKLHFLADGRIMWVGGDGSYRAYRPIEGVAGKWAAAHVSDGPDTLYTTTYPHSAYERRLRGGGRVIFNGAGFHAATVNRLDHATSFGYHSNGSLGAIYIPHGPGYGLTNIQYRFNYGGAAGRLAQVQSTDLGGNVTRSVAIHHGTTGRVESIVDPGLPAVSFTFSSGFPGWVQTRTDRTGTVTTYSYNNLKLATSELNMQGTGANISRVYSPEEASGLARIATPSDLVYTRLDGPRTDVGDTTALYLDRWGGPRRIRDALGNQTVLFRENAAFPALVTRSVAPNGFTQRAEFDAFGRVRRVMAENARGDGAVDVTRYEYDNVYWPDFATRIVPPEGDSVVIAYRGDGGRHSQTDALGRTVYFRYYESGPHKGMPRATDMPETPADSVVYDMGLGNLAETYSPGGYPTRVTTDNLGRVVLTTTPLDPGWTKVNSVRVTYDAAGRDTLVVTSGPAMSYTLDGQDHGAPPVAAEETRVAKQYDAEGNLLAVSTSGAPGGTVDVQSSFVYDRAGRVTEEVVGPKHTFREYDVAGNVLRMYTPRTNPGVSMQYDALNRLVVRTMLPMRFGSSGCGPHGGGLGCEYKFPLYPNDGTGGLKVPGDTATFTYDLMGNMLTAYNRTARIDRSYTPGGLLSTDTTRIRRYGASVPGECTSLATCPPEIESWSGGVEPSGGDFASVSSVTSPYPAGEYEEHVYGLGYRYDRNGRLRDLLGLGAPGTSRDSTRYSYNQAGELSGVRDPMDNLFSFLYDNDGRPRRTIYPGGVYDSLAYNVDGNLTRRATVAPAQVIRDDSLEYDYRGKVVRVDDQRSDDFVENRYSALGTLVATRHGENMIHYTLEEYRSDPLGHMYWSRTLDPKTGIAPVMSYGYGNGSAVLEKIAVDVSAATGFRPDTTYTRLDGSGNVFASGSRSYERVYSGGPIGGGPPNYKLVARTAVQQYYGADERLAFLQKYDWTEARRNGTYDEYRYDALGRRVLMRMRRDSLCYGASADCTSTIERFVWSGDQLLYEFRSPGGDNATASQLESDVATGDEFGRVAYTHASGIDQPLSVVRRGHVSGTAVIIPALGHRGSYYAGTSANGHISSCLPNDPCLWVVWPKGSWGSYYASGDPSRGDWAGSLMNPVPKSGRVQ